MAVQVQDIAAAVPATVASIIAAWKAFRAAEQVKPSNGTKTAAIVETTAKDVKALTRDLRTLKDDVQYHVTVQHGRGPSPEPLVALPSPPIPPRPEG